MYTHATKESGFPSTENGVNPKNVIQYKSCPRDFVLFVLNKYYEV